MNAFSGTYRNGRKFTRRRERQMAFLKALGEAGSVAHAAAIIDVAAPRPTRGATPCWVSPWLGRRPLPRRRRGRGSAPISPWRRTA